MKIKSLAFVLSLGLLSSAYAEERHFHPGANKDSAPKQESVAPGACEVEIINDSYNDINVYGRFDDGAYLTPFMMKYYDVPHYINLYYNGFCHLGMDFYIETIDGKHKYNGFTPVGKTIRIKSY